MTNGPVMFIVRGPLEGQSAVVDRVLHALPDWFGIEASIVDYIHAAAELPTFIAVTGDAPNEVVGFVTLKPTSECALEVHVMGVLREWHRRGAGRALVESAAAYARSAGHEFLHVKTLAPTHSDPSYALTRAFYLAMGFRPLEIIPQVWGAENPCLLLIKTL